MQTINISDILCDGVPSWVKPNTPYFAIGVEGTGEDEDGYEDDESDVRGLEYFNFEVKILKVVKNPKYLDYTGHMLQLSIVTYKGK